MVDLVVQSERGWNDWVRWCNDWLGWWYNDWLRWCNDWLGWWYNDWLRWWNDWLRLLCIRSGLLDLFSLLINVACSNQKNFRRGNEKLFPDEHMMKVIETMLPPNDERRYLYMFAPQKRGVEFVSVCWTVMNRHDARHRRAMDLCEQTCWQFMNS